ncbi:MAG: DNA replication/repair protein RecF [Cytophagales bacterium]|nr:MAG: DNA replication and repair protein RecF [Rhodothermaeota bacterium MED-G19]
MHIDKIKINNFKNYISSEVKFSNKINFLFGKNGSGKTNLLDAIYYLSYGKSAINNFDSDNVLAKESFFRIEGDYSNNNSYTCTFEQPNVKKIFENNEKYLKVKDHLGKIPLVFITPYDINLIRNYSSERRKFFDQLFSQIDKNYLNNLIAYNRLLKQRNTYIKSISNLDDIDNNYLKVYDEKLIQLNNSIHSFRESELEKFNESFNHVSNELNNSKNNFNVYYSSNFNKEMNCDIYEKYLEKDFYTKKTNIGIHNDDYSFMMNNKLIKRIGSQGQQKTFIISLKLSEFYLLKKKLLITPILLLDDIFHKLDDTKINTFVKYILGNNFSQIFISDSLEDRLHKMKKIIHPIKIFNIDKGIINEE